MDVVGDVDEKHRTVSVGGEDLCQSLRRWFGHDGFRPGQENVVRRILSGEELCVVMPTGAGKSLCYQLPILLRPGFGLVISPLIALMQDQVEGLNARGLPAACINHSVSLSDQNQALYEAACGRLKFLYVAPERFRSPGFMDFLDRHRPSLLVIDEAHCISQWGHDFRPDYQRIWRSCPLLGELQACAFTATATPQVRDDIREQLERPDMLDIVTGFRRPNLHFSVVRCRTNSDKDALLSELLKKKVPSIIYASTRKEVERVSQVYDIRMYHAGMSDVQRREAQHYFSTDPCPMLVATNAFGMGIDRADIRRVIHVSMPGSLEAYYQEAGRAGRDGQPADCILVENYVDVRTQEFLVKANNPSYELLSALHRMLLRDRCSDGSVLWVPEFAEEELSGLADPPAQLSMAPRILERLGLVERSYAYAGGTVMQLTFHDSLDSLEHAHESQETQRSIFVYRLSRWLQRCGKDRFRGTLADLCSCTGFRPDQIGRLLDALKGKVLELKTGQVESILMLTEAGLKEPFELDRVWLHKKSQLDHSRLDGVLSYCHCTCCRQLHMLKYFGEEVGTWHCELCDRCGAGTVGGRPATEQENTLARQVLQALRLVDGRFGRRRIVGLLLGASDDSEDITEHPYYGLLKVEGRSKVEAVMGALENGGYIGVTAGDYPCLELTAAGEKALKGRDFGPGLRFLDGGESRRSGCRKRSVKRHA